MDSSSVDTELLCRALANHLFLAQFEPFRAMLQSLKARNPDLARSILQTIIAKGGRFDSVQWSSHPSCPSPALLTFLCTLELLQFNDPTSQLWSFDENTLKLRAEFSLYVQMIASRVAESVEKGRDLEGSEIREKGVKGFEEKGEKVEESEGFRGFEGGLDKCLRVLDRISDVGLSRLRPDLIGEDGEEEVGGGGEELREEEIMCLRRVILEQADVFDVLCENIRIQVGWVEYDEEEKVEESNMAITLRTEGRTKGKGREMEEEGDLLKLVQRCVQIVHLDAMRDCLEKYDVDGAVTHLRFLHLGYGVEETDYRKVLQHLLERILSEKDDYGDIWLANRGKLLAVYAQMLSSGCIGLVQLLQVIQDELLSEKIEALRSSDKDKIPYPLRRLQNFIMELKPDTDSNDKTSLLNIATTSCMREMYHYARVCGLHVLECIVDTALSAVRKEQLQEASNVLSLFPRLQPLVAVMGWDLLSGKTTLRRKLMQLLWTSKSQVFRLEESHFYNNESDEVSCIEHLCDLLCYQLDLASFVACVNSGQSWTLKSSLLLCGKESVESATEDVQWDPFVENFVLERLSVQSPLRVLFDVVPSIKFQDALKLISMQPITSTLAAWKRMQDVELMHMRYALESAVLALGAMERRMSDAAGNNQLILCYLKDLKSHLDAISNNPRKILMVNIVISLLYMDDLSLNLTPSGPSGGISELSNVSGVEQADFANSEGGSKMVVSFIGQLLGILRQNLQSLTSAQETASGGNISASGKQALEWRILNAKRCIEDWEWRVSILQRLLPLSERRWRWKEALTILRAAPSKLLNLCMQKAKFDIGEEAVHRFSLPAEDKAMLELAEWVDGAFKRASV